MWDPYAEFETVIFSNGLQVHAAYWPDRPWEAMSFVVHSGAENDPTGLEGTAHFVEHAVSENADVPKTNLENLFENLGGSVNLGTTNYPATHYGFFTPANHATLHQALGHFGNMLTKAHLHNNLERERAIINTEFNGKFPFKPQIELHERERRILYHGTWIENFISSLGWPRTIAQISTDDLQLFYDTHYTPANISIVGIGGIRFSNLLEMLGDTPFADRKNGLRTPLPRPFEMVDPPVETRCIFRLSEHVEMKNPISVGSYRMVCKMPGTVSDSVMQILGEMLDEILTTELRERRGKTYHIECNFHNYRLYKEFSINCNDADDSTLEIIESIVENCIAVATDEKLFAKIQHRILGRLRMLDVRARGILSGVVEDLSYLQRITTLSDAEKEVTGITFQNICDALRWLAPEYRWTLLYRP